MLGASWTILIINWILASIQVFSYTDFLFVIFLLGEDQRFAVASEPQESRSLDHQGMIKDWD